MSRQGWRSVCVDDVQYNWCFNWRGNGILQVQAADHRNGQRLTVDWGWVDHLEPEYSSSSQTEPQIVTPRFVAQAIRFAVENGWTPDSKGPNFKLDCEEGDFAV